MDERLAIKSLLQIGTVYGEFFTKRIPRVGR